jgi:hypothetical protein
LHSGSGRFALRTSLSIRISHMLVVICGSCLIASFRTRVPPWPLERAMTSSMARWS